MRENILNLPQYLRRLPLVNSEQVALAMAGEYTRNILDDLDRYQEPERWQAAQAFHTCILIAVKLGKLTTAHTFYASPGIPSRALFIPGEIWPWALAELSDGSLWYGAQETSVLSLPPTATPPTDETSHNRNASNESLQLLNAGLARLLVARSHSAYLHGKKTNISALARDAAAEVAYALPPDADKTETFRKLLTESLSLLPSDVMPLDK